MAPSFFSSPLFFDLVGMTGTFLVVAAYVLLQMEKLSATSLAFNLINLLGAVLLLISLCFNFNLASFVIEIFWIGASLLGLYKYCRSSPGKNNFVFTKRK